MKPQATHKKEVAVEGEISMTTVNPGGSHTPKVNAKPRNRKSLSRMSPKETLMQMSLECDILKLGHLRSSCELRLIGSSSFSPAFHMV